MSKEVLISDIDGTILTNGSKVSHVVDYLNSKKLPIHLLTNRQESTRNETIAELDGVGIKYETLTMNEGSDKSGVFKKSKVKKMMDDGISPIEFVDDSVANRNAVASLGIKVTDPKTIQTLDCGVSSIKKPMTLEESLKALKAAFSGKNAEAEAMSKELSALKEANETLNAEFKTVKENLEASAAIVAERDSAIAKIEELTKALAASEQIKAEASAQIESVAKKSASIAASVGVAPLEITSAEVTAPKTNEEIWSEYCGMKDQAAKQAFYNKNRSAIISHLGIK